MAQEPRYLLGIDLGTTAVKSLLLDADGAVAGSATAPLSLAIPRPGWSEQDPAEWWTATGASVRNVMAQTGIRPETIAGVAESATGQYLRPMLERASVKPKVVETKPVRAKRTRKVSVDEPDLIAAK